MDFDIEQNIPYLVMEYAPNGALRQRHPKGTRVPLPLIVRYVRQIASALHYAHTQRLIHPPRPTATPVPTTSASLYTYTGHQDQVYTAAWSPNGQLIASAGGNRDTKQGDTAIYVWSAQAGQYGSPVFTYTGHKWLVRMVAWSPDGTRIASASEDGYVKVWDATTRKLTLIYTGHKQPIMSVQWSRDGKSIVSSSFDKTVQIWTMP